MNEKLVDEDQQLLKTANRKQQNTDKVLLLVDNCDIKLEILNKSSNLSQSGTLITVMSVSFFGQGFSVVHVIITTIISKSTMKYKYIRLSYFILGKDQNSIINDHYNPSSSILSSSLCKNLISISGSLRDSGR